MTRLANNLFSKDRCALPDQMPFVLTFPWRGFVFGEWNRDRTNLDEIAIFAFSVTTQDFPHDILFLSVPGSMRPPARDGERCKVIHDIDTHACTGVSSPIWSVASRYGVTVVETAPIPTGRFVGLDLNQTLFCSVFRN